MSPTEVICTTAFGSIFTIKCDHDGVKEKNNSQQIFGKLHCESYYCTGELALQIQQCNMTYNLNLKKKNNIIVIMSILGAITGMIPLLPEQFDLLEKIQHEILNNTSIFPFSPKYHTTYRSSEIQNKNFLDGDLLNYFHELELPLKESIAVKCNSTTIEIISLLDEISSQLQ